MTAYDAARWSDFALAQLGASAALLGLVFVGLSINLRQFITTSSLVNRAAESVIGLGTVLVAATAVLIPEQSEDALAVELLVVALVTLVSAGFLERNAAVRSDDSRPAPPSYSLLLRRLFGLGAPLLLVVTAVTLLLEGGGGLYWWPAAIVSAYVSAITNAWVLMIEVLR